MNSRDIERELIVMWYKLEYREFRIEKRVSMIKS